LTTPDWSDFKEQVRSQTDLVALVSETVSLQPRRGGSDFAGLCPFHDDHSPSFHVYPDRQTYRCWACNEGGDCFSWVMKIDGLPFRDTLELLAQRANIELPRRMPGRSEESRQNKASLYEIVAWAEGEFHRCLLEAPEASRAREYLRQRGFLPETVRQFRIGYHPDNWEWLLTKARGRFTPEQLYAARLVRARNEGNGYYDDFVDRLLFPIRDTRGRPVAFGGRILPDNQRPGAPKYLNSPESELFTKSSLLYGFDVARDGIRKSRTTIVVEGYTDCIIAHQYGINNVVGTLGTALTETHVTLLKRLANKVVQCFDGDEAGQNAVNRSLTKFIAQDVDLRILTLPAGIDPADFLRQEDADAFRQRVENAPELWDHKLQAAIHEFGVESIQARQNVLVEMLDLLAVAPRLSGTPRESLILSRLSQRVALQESEVRKQLATARRAHAQRGGSSAQSIGSDDGTPTDNLDQFDRMEVELLEVIFAAPEAVGTIQSEIAAAELAGGPVQNLLQLCYDLAEQGVVPSFERVVSELEDADQKRFAIAIEDESRRKQIAQKMSEHDTAGGPGEPAGYLHQIIENLKWRRRRQVHEQSKGQIAGLANSTDTLDSQAKQLLLRSAEFHKKRVQRQAST